MFTYTDGCLYYKKDHGKKKRGQRAGSKIKSFPYRRVTLYKKKFLEHRVIFFLCHGYWPEIVDHANGDKLDNRIENLRAATVSQNAYNRTAKQSGARLHRYGKWEAYISQNKGFISLGYFNCETAAKLASAKARIKMSGGFYTPFTERSNST
jgi:hypothetical protein